MKRFSFNGLKEQWENAGMGVPVPFFIWKIWCTDQQVNNLVFICFHVWKYLCWVESTVSFDLREVQNVMLEIMDMQWPSLLMKSSFSCSCTKISLKCYHEFPFSPRKILEPLKKVIMDYLEALYLRQLFKDVCHGVYMNESFGYVFSTFLHLWHLTNLDIVYFRLQRIYQTGLTTYLFLSRKYQLFQ